MRLFLIARAGGFTPRVCAHRGKRRWYSGPGSVTRTRPLHATPRGESAKARREAQQHCSAGLLGASCSAWESLVALESLPAAPVRSLGSRRIGLGTFARKRAALKSRRLGGLGARSTQAKKRQAMSDRPSKPENAANYVEGESASRTFSDAVRDLFSVPKSEIDKREKAYKRGRVARKKKRAAGS